MGLGKSVCTLTAFADAMRGFESRRMLVVAPKRVARDVWDDEIARWSHLHGLTISKMVGSRAERLAAYKKPADIHTINREQLDWLFRGHVEEIAPNRFRQIRKWPWDWITLDEAQSYKNQESARTKAVHRVSTLGLAERIVELTGTPASKGYVDLWAQLFVLDHGRRLGASEKAFKDRWFDAPAFGQHRWKLKDGAAEQIQNAVRDLVLSLHESDYLDLPPVLHNRVRVRLSAAAQREYDKFERSSVLKLDGVTLTAANAGVLHGRLLQYASGAIYTDDRGNYQRLHDAKLDALRDVLDELAFSGPVIIGYRFRHEAELIGKLLDRYCSTGQRWEILKSAASLKSFARGEIDFGLMHPMTGGHGLNDLHLSGSENIVWPGPTDDLELWDQLNARIAGGHRRMGKNVTIHCLIAEGTADMTSLQMLIDKDIDQVGLVKALRDKYV